MGLSESKGYRMKNFACFARFLILLISSCRCVNFILASDGSCVERCSGEADIRTEGPLLGNVCIRKSSSGHYVGLDLLVQGCG
jgi:hypothetical protein